MSESSDMEDVSISRAAHSNDSKRNQQLQSKQQAVISNDHIRKVTGDMLRAQAAAKISAQITEASTLLNHPSPKVNLDEVRKKLSDLTSGRPNNKTEQLSGLQIRSFSELQLEHGVTRPKDNAAPAITSDAKNSGPSTAAAKSSGEGGGGGGGGGSTLQAEIERPLTQVNRSFAVDAILRALAQLPKTNLIFNQQQITGEEALKRIRADKSLIPLLDASYCQVTFSQSGLFMMQNGKYDLPACCRGSNCIITQYAYEIRGSESFTDTDRPRTLMAFMYTDELRLFFSEQRLPADISHRVCVGCIMHAFATAVLVCTNAGTNTRLDTVSRIQPFRVVHDIVGGFYKRYVYTPNERAWGGFVCPFPRFDIQDWEWKKDRQNRWYVDISQTFFKPLIERATVGITGPGAGGVAALPAPDLPRGTTDSKSDADFLD